jgi:periplasmic nitrate reductase NapD
MSDELHIAGVVVHAYPKGMQRVAAAIERLSGAEVCATSDDGKLVVTLEASSARAITANIDQIQRFDGVLSASLVYQHSESLEAMMEEVTHEDHTPGLR